MKKAQSQQMLAVISTAIVSAATKYADSISRAATARKPAAGIACDTTYAVTPGLFVNALLYHSLGKAGSMDPNCRDAVYPACVLERLLLRSIPDNPSKSTVQKARDLLDIVQDVANNSSSPIYCDWFSNTIINPYVAAYQADWERRNKVQKVRAGRHIFSWQPRCGKMTGFLTNLAATVLTPAHISAKPSELLNSIQDYLSCWISSTGKKKTKKSKAVCLTPKEPQQKVPATTETSRNTASKEGNIKYSYTLTEHKWDNHKQHGLKTNREFDPIDIFDKYKPELQMRYISRALFELQACKLSDSLKGDLKLLAQHMIKIANR